MAWEDLLGYFFSSDRAIYSGYNALNTLAYAIVLVAAVYLGFRILKRLKVAIDVRFALALSPFVLLGSTLRVLQDMGTLDYFFLVTPFIYSFVASVACGLFIVSLLLDRKKGVPYFKTMFVSGLVLLGFFIGQVRPVNFSAVALVGLFLLPWLAIFKFVKWGKSDKVVSSIQMFDATTTFVALNFFGYSEQHVLPNFAIGIFGPFSFVLLKLAAIVSILVLIDRFSDNREFNLYLKIVIGILGASTGSRDLLRMLSMV